MRKKKFEILVILIASGIFVLFCNWIMTELPHMTWFDFLPLVDKFYNKNLNFTDLFTRYGEHGMFGYNILFLINTCFFNLTTFFDVYVNDIIVIISGIMFVYLLKKYVNTSMFSYKVGVLIIALVNFSTIQLSSGAMETQVRLGILFFIISTVYVDNLYFENGIVSYKKTIVACILIILSINVFGTLYNFAGLPMIFIVGFLILLKDKKRIKSVLPILITYIISTILYIFEYNLFSGSGAVDSLSMFNNIFSIIKHPIVTIKSLLGYNASGLFGAAVYLDGNKPVNIYLWIGLAITLIILFSLYQYFSTKMYKKTFLPLFFIAYSFGVFIFILIGRSNLDWQWSMNEWYIVHMKLQYIGVIWILIYTYQISERNIFMPKLLISLSFCIITFTSLIGNGIEIKRAPYITIYYEEKQPYLFVKSIDDLPVDGNGNTPLLANSQMTFNSIQILKKYGLSVYKYYPIYEKAETLFQLK